MIPCSQTLRNLVRNERGNVMMTFGLTSLIAVAAVGGAVDFGRAYQQKSRMQNALDAAVIAGVSVLKETNDWSAAEARALGVFRSIFNNAITPTPQNPAPQPAIEQPVVRFQQQGTQMSASVQMTTNTPFMHLVIGQNLAVGAASNAAPPSGNMVEVAVMVDLTGSMGWSAAAPATNTPCGSVASPDSKLDYLKCAGEDLLNILLPADGSNNSAVKIGIAPFSEKVNAGSYAAAVTGLDATGGTYTPIANLASTRQGPMTGATYSGSTAGYGGFGATGSTPPAGATSTPGATFSNSYCAVPTTTSTSLISLRTKDGYRVGVELTRDSSDWNPTNAIAGIITLGDSAPSADGFKKISSVDGNGDSWDRYMNYYSGTDNKGYFVPMPESFATLTKRTFTYGGYTGNIGAYVPIEEDNYIDSTDAANLQSIGYVKATSSQGYWKVTKVNINGTLNLSWSTSGWYIPLYTSLSSTTTTTVPGCESTTTTASSKLISCVTERKNGTALDYTDDAPASGKYVGPYNFGSTAKSNYSSDGKCYVAGRELPAVIPLTNDRSTLTSFFASATAGGATAGHLGTAWAQYILSPDWSSIWPSASQPAAYTNTGVKKAAILMTDGEYNIQFFTGGNSSANTSAKQALELCKSMRDNGITVYTIGFGFASGATPPNPNVEAMSATDRVTPLTGSYTSQQKALDTLAKCASSNSSYYFPYDGEALRTVFKNIATSLSVSVSQGKARLTN